MVWACRKCGWSPPDGIKPKQCSPCTVRRAAEWRKKNPAAVAAANKKYAESEKGKAARKKYSRSPKRREASKRFYLSEKGRAAREEIRGSEKYLLAQERYRKSPKGLAYQAAKKRKYRAERRYWAQERARETVARAKRTGRLIAPSECQRCGCPGPVEAHHWKGYEREFWLDVQWVCKRCHLELEPKGKAQEGMS